MEVRDRGLRLEEGETGLRAVVTGPWTPGVERTVVERGVKELYLNYALGWAGHDLSFLARMSDLRLLWVLDRSIEKTSAVGRLKHLRVLRLDVGGANDIELDELLELEEYSGNLRAKMQSLWRSHGLRRLRLVEMANGLEIRLDALPSLECAALYSPCVRSVASVSPPPTLRSLSLAHARELESLQGVEGVPDLEELILDHCPRISSLDPLTRLSRLRTLVLADCGHIASLAPLATLKALEVVRFDGATVVDDGDLSPLQSLPGLRALGFTPRRHYRPRWTEFPRSLFESRYSLLWG